MRRFFSALSFLTVIPVPQSLKSTRDNGMFAGYPAVGLLLGILYSVLLFCARFLLSMPISTVLLLAVMLFLTGAIHLDGLADCADAFYGHRDRETTLRILKDPRIGTMGGAAIGLSLLARYAALVSIPQTPVLLALPFATAFSRTSVLMAMRALPYVRSTGILNPTVSVTRPLVALACLVILAILIAFPIPTAAAALALALFWRLSWKRIGGCTGDVLGATIEIAEIVFLVAFAGAEALGFPLGGVWGLLGQRV
ncbi:MAG TPA: adenosylcobinamide-GDP ribazoletransferase [Spirochaetia bacterium]|nr:adenosylcobinamide-GDP ribazoletransferase [Spirochaetia bacterium]